MSYIHRRCWPGIGDCMAWSCLINGRLSFTSAGHGQYNTTMYQQRPFSGSRPLACNWYYCAQFIAKPKAACALRFRWAATSSSRGV